MDEEEVKPLSHEDDGRLWGDGEITSLLRSGPNCTVHLAVPVRGPRQISWNSEDVGEMSLNTGLMFCLDTTLHGKINFRRGDLGSDSSQCG